MTSDELENRLARAHAELQAPADAHVAPGRGMGQDNPARRSQRPARRVWMRSHSSAKTGRARIRDSHLRTSCDPCSAWVSGWVGGRLSSSHALASCCHRRCLPIPRKPRLAGGSGPGGRITSRMPLPRGRKGLLAYDCRMDPTHFRDVVCSFCGRHNREVRVVTNDAGLVICQVCVAKCAQIFDEEVGVQPTQDWAGRWPLNGRRGRFVSVSMRVPSRELFFDSGVEQCLSGSSCSCWCYSRSPSSWRSAWPSAAAPQAARTRRSSRGTAPAPTSDDETEARRRGTLRAATAQVRRRQREARARGRPLRRPAARHHGTRTPGPRRG